jgi:16S rRNA (guanine(966)-N(2))-methyltransferase RsmD
VRVIAGDLARRAIEVPRGVRPSEGRVREALFSTWQHRVPGSRFLDLFAGSGAVGFEAVSRGAAAVVCAEKDLAVLRTLEATARRVGAGTLRGVRASLPGDLAAWPERGLGPFDLVFADPPYAFVRHAALLQAVGPLLAPGAEVALEHSIRVETPPVAAGLLRTASRRYGESALSFYEWSAAEQKP